MTHPEFPLMFQRCDAYEVNDGWQSWPVLPDHGDVDLLTVRWRALGEVRSSDPLHLDGSLMPPGPEDGVRHIVVRDDGTMIEVAIAATDDVAVHIAELHNAWM